MAVSVETIGYILVRFWFVFGYTLVCFWFSFGSISVIEMAVSVEEKATYPHGRVAILNLKNCYEQKPMVVSKSRLDRRPGASVIVLVSFFAEVTQSVLYRDG